MTSTITRPETITASIETIDRAKAHEYLRDNQLNRQQSEAYAQLLADRQRNGEWKTNGDTIRFDTNGHLRDGQHRLMMVTRTGIPITVVVVRGVDPDAFLTMDAGKKRDLTSVLYINRQPLPSKVAAGLRRLWSYLYNRSSTQVSHQQFLELLDEHPQLHESVEFYVNRKSDGKDLGYEPVMTTGHYLFSRVDRDRADDFMDRLLSGAGLTAQDPRLVLRKQITGYRLKKTTLSQDQVMDLMAQAWNRLADGKEAKRGYRLKEKPPFRPGITGFPAGLLKETRRVYPEDEEEESSDE